MMFFNNIKPRRFNHRMIYTDERKERLKAIKERARRQLGMTEATDRQPVRDLHGAFSGSTERLRARRQQARRGISSGVLIAIIAVLLIVMFQMLTGRTLF